MPVLPIFVKCSSWNQSEGNIVIRVPSHGIFKSKVDFTVAEKYIKAHYKPFIFELFLWKSVDVHKCSCTVTDTEILFELIKSEKEIWELLEADIDKSEKIKLRNEAITKIQEANQEKCKEKQKIHAELKRTAVRAQIVADNKQHERIASLKKIEKENALKDLQLFEEKHPNEIETKEDFLNKKKQKYKTPSVEYPQQFYQKKEELKIQPSIPLPRKCKTINVTFTPREFPTPKRESRSKEEEEWLAKQAEARRTIGFCSKDLKPEERNPQWLKEKGDDFFRNKNYLGALSAYSEGIKISKDFVNLYVNRSAAHFAIGNLHKTIEDCSKALEIMTPPVPANLALRAKCLARRGAALCKLGLLKQGNDEFEAALKLLPNDEKLKQDFEKIKVEMSLSS